MSDEPEDKYKPGTRVKIGDKRFFVRPDRWLEEIPSAPNVPKKTFVEDVKIDPDDGKNFTR